MEVDLRYIPLIDGELYLAKSDNGKYMAFSMSDDERSHEVSLFEKCLFDGSFRKIALAEFSSVRNESLVNLKDLEKGQVAVETNIALSRLLRRLVWDGYSQEYLDYDYTKRLYSGMGLESQLEIFFKN